MPLPRPMATPHRPDTAGAPSLGADAPSNFRFRLASPPRARADPGKTLHPTHYSMEARPSLHAPSPGAYWAAQKNNEQLRGRDVQ